MPDVLAVLGGWWKRIAAFTFLATALAFLIVWLLPKTYSAVATALPASSFANDKATIFNANIQELYSTLGTADDLDRIIGTAHLDTLYIALAAEQNLATHYRFGTSVRDQYSAAQRLKKHTTVAKSEWGELKITVRDTDPALAAQLANGLLKKLQLLHQSLRNQSNALVLQKLREAGTLLHTTDSARSEQPNGFTQNGQKTYTDLLSEYSFMVTTNPPVLLVVESARPPLYADITEKAAVVIATFFAAFLFSFLLALYTEGKKARA